MTNIHPIRDSVGAAAMVAAAMQALGRVEERSTLMQELRYHLAAARTARAIQDELYDAAAFSEYNPTPAQDMAYSEAERAEADAHDAIKALFSGLTPAERRQLGGIL